MKKYKFKLKLIYPEVCVFPTEIECSNPSEAERVASTEIMGYFARRYEKVTYELSCSEVPSEEFLIRNTLYSKDLNDK